MRRCACGDLRRAHSHYRPGMDCSQCPCPGFRWRWLHWMAWRRFARVRPLL